MNERGVTPTSAHKIKEIWLYRHEVNKKVYLLLMCVHCILKVDKNTSDITKLQVIDDLNCATRSAHSMLRNIISSEDKIEPYPALSIHNRLLSLGRTEDISITQLIPRFIVDLKQTEAEIKQSAEKLISDISDNQISEFIDGAEALMYEDGVAEFIRSNYTALYSYIESQYELSPEDLREY